MTYTDTSGNSLNNQGKLLTLQVTTHKYLPRDVGRHVMSRKTSPIVVYT